MHMHTRKSGSLRCLYLVHLVLVIESGVRKPQSVNLENERPRFSANFQMLR
jgi:hypothetical protein